MKKILAIDDNTDNLELIKTILKRDIPNCNVFTSKLGEEGIVIAKKEIPDTILLDIHMPEMDGFVVCEILKNNETTKSIPILLVSGLGHETNNRIKGLNYGADAFISKPFDKAELVALVNVMLRIKQAEDLLKKRNENLEIFIKKQTKEFNENEERFLQISEYALEFFWEIDAYGVFTYISPVAERILGYKIDEIIGTRTLFDFPFQKNNKNAKEELIKFFESRSNYNEQEVIGIQKNDKKIWLKINGFPIFNEKSEFVGYRGVTHDITRHKQSEEDLRKSMAEIKTYQKQLKNLNSELIYTEDKERRRIAEYIHDSIAF